MRARAAAPPCSLRGPRAPGVAVAEEGRHDRYRPAAGRFARWLALPALDPRAPAGFIGGLYGYDDTPQRLTWKSTEHNTDLAAVFEWLERVEPERGWRSDAE